MEFWEGKGEIERFGGKKKRKWLRKFERFSNLPSFKLFAKTIYSSENSLKIFNNLKKYIYFFIFKVLEFVEKF